MGPTKQPENKRNLWTLAVLMLAATLLVAWLGPVRCSEIAEILPDQVRIIFPGEEL